MNIRLGQRAVKHDRGSLQAATYMGGKLGAWCRSFLPEASKSLPAMPRSTFWHTLLSLTSFVMAGLVNITGQNSPRVQARTRQSCPITAPGHSTYLGALPPVAQWNPPHG